METFIKSIILDEKAVKNAIDYTQSNGIVEGLVNKLKNYKTQMYGRALKQLKRKMALTNKILILSLLSSGNAAPIRCGNTIIMSQ